MKSTMVKISGKEIVLKDRRRVERYDVPDAQVELLLMGDSHKENRLVDISFHTIRVITSLVLHEEQDVAVRLKTPLSKPLTLKGFVLRIDEFPGKKDKFIVAINFHPFSTYERYNNLEDRKILKTILDNATLL